jgi:hypothetical protein
MSDKFQIRESERYPLLTPVEIRWTDSGRQCHSVRGTSHDVSIFGLGITVPSQVPFDQDLTVLVNGVKVCGEALLRHSRPFESGFRIGLYFRLTLLMQNITELDDLLDRVYPSGSEGHRSVVPALMRRFRTRLWRVLTAEPAPTLPQAGAVDNSPLAIRR